MTDRRLLLLDSRWIERQKSDACDQLLEPWSTRTNLRFSRRENAVGEYVWAFTLKLNRSTSRSARLRPEAKWSTFEVRLLKNGPMNTNETVTIGKLIIECIYTATHFEKKYVGFSRIDPVNQSWNYSGPNRNRAISKSNYSKMAP